MTYNLAHHKLLVPIDPGDVPGEASSRRLQLCRCARNRQADYKAFGGGSFFAQCKVINLARNNMLALGTRDDGVFFSVLSFFCYPLMLYAAQVATPTGVTFATVCGSARHIPSSPACAYLRTSHPCISLEKSLGSTGEMIMAARARERKYARGWALSWPYHDL